MKGRKRYTLIFFCVNIAVPIILGALIYLFFRKDTYISIFISKYLALPNPESVFSPFIEKTLKNYFADTMWAYSLTFSVLLILGYSKKNLFITFGVCSIFETTIECLQKTKLFHGTFDVLDIAFELITTIFALLVIKKYFEEVKHKNEKATYSN